MGASEWTEVDQWTEEQAQALRVAIGRFVRAGRSGDQVSSSQAGVLGELDRSGPLTISQLAHLGQVRHQSMRQMVHLLQGSGLITVRAHDSDARKKLCEISVSGREALDRDRTARTRWILAAANHRLDAEERRVAARIPELLMRLSDQASTSESSIELQSL